MACSSGSGSSSSGTANKGTVQVKFELPVNSLSKSVSKNLLKEEVLKASIDDAKSLLISIKDLNGDFVYENHKLELYKMGDYFISSVISLPIGDYKLEKFMVMDGNNNGIFATPVGETKFVIQNPLPLDLKIEKDKVNKFVPEIIEVGDATPEEFGYGSFSFNYIKTFDFLISIFTWNNKVQNWELTDAEIEILDENSKTVSSGKLEAVTNVVKVPVGKNNDKSKNKFTVRITQPNTDIYEEIFTEEELINFYNSSNKGPLKVFLKEFLSEAKILLKVATNSAIDIDKIKQDNDYSEAYLDGDYLIWSKPLNSYIYSSNTYNGVAGEKVNIDLKIAINSS